MSGARPIVFYTTPHGYGHSARTCDIIRALQRDRPDIPVMIVSGVEETFFAARLRPKPFVWRHGVFDVGLVQLDSVRADIEATLQAWQGLLPRWETLLQQEIAFLRKVGAALVVSDIPALPLKAAQAVGIPSVAAGNFGWNWIYSDYLSRDPGWAGIVQIHEEVYRQTDLLLHLPFSEPMSSFPHRRSIPLVAEPGQGQRDWIHRRTGADPEKPWFLLSFSTLEWDDDALHCVAAQTHVEFFTILPLTWNMPNLHALDRGEIAFHDVVASADAVISKPGFGILSECVVNAKPLIYVERTDFIEYPILERGLQESLRNVHLPAVDLYRGNLAASLAAIFDAPPPPTPLTSGGATIAAEILGRCRDEGIQHSPG